MTISSRLFAGAATSVVLAAMATSQAVAAPPDTTPAAPPTVSLQEVVVTAQKRVENAQKAPLAVTSLNAQALAEAHVTGATDLSRVVPDVRVSVGGAAGDPGGGSAVFSIRGLGASATGPQGSAGVAQHFDGVYRQTGISNSEFFDLERIEVDPGPQGTLYGRSAAAGAINVIPNKPTHVFEGSAGIEFGNYGEIRSDAVLNVPVNDTLALRASFESQNHNGYLTNGYDDQDSKSGRLQALWQPTSKLTIRLYGDVVHLGGRGASDIFVGGATLPEIAAVAPPLNNSDPRARSIARYCLINGHVETTCQQSIDFTRWSIHADMSYNFGWGVLSIIPAYIQQRDTNYFANAPLPLSYYNQIPNDDNETSLEVRLSDPGGGRLKWVGGFNYYHNTVDATVLDSVNPLAGELPVFGPGGVVGVAPAILHIDGLNAQNSEQNAYALFGQSTYALEPWLRLTAGGRYNYDDASYNGTLSTKSQTLYYLNGAAFPDLPGVPDITSPISTGPLATRVDFHDFTYRLAIDGDLTPTSLVYASIGSGYKPGGLNDGGTIASNSPAALAALGAQLTPKLTAAQALQYAPSNVFRPEKVTHYELGSKNRFFNNRLQVNDALYYDDYSNYQNGQTEVVNPLIYRAQGFSVTNAGKARVYGNEFSTKFQATPYDQFGFTVNYLHATFTSFIAPAYLTPAGTAAAVDLTGKPLPNAPKWSGTLSYQHIFELPDGGRISADVFSSISEGYQTDYAESSGTQQSSYTRTTLNLTWTDPHRLWTVTGFANNLEDSLVKSFGLASAGYSQVHLDPPRTYGVSATRRF